MNIMLSFIVLSLIMHCSSAGRNVYPKVKSLKPDGDPGEPLFLTPYIENGRIIEARNASRVPALLGVVESYSGFLTINESTNSNMFFWFFTAENNPQKAPVALWLQGGPGDALISAVFTVNGPFIITDSLTLERRSAYWSQEINVIYIDNPVGAGFSFANEEGYVTNESEVGRDLYAVLLQFFQLFPEFQENDFFVTGVSYAGKYIPAIAYTILKNNPTAFQKINLKGIAIGDGFVDPESMMGYGNYLFQHGLIDSRALVVFNQMEKEIVGEIQAKNFTNAFASFDELMASEITDGSNSIFNDITGLSSVNNYATSNTIVDTGGSVEDWLSNSQNRRSIHVGSVVLNEGSAVRTKLLSDLMQSVLPWLEVLLENYRVLLFNGQFDIICAYPLTMNYVKKMQWSGKQAYDKARRKFWYVNGELAGYTKSAGNFMEILVRNAGHVVPADQPVWALDMISKFTKNIRF